VGSELAPTRNAVAELWWGRPWIAQRQIGLGEAQPSRDVSGKARRELFQELETDLGVAVLEQRCRSQDVERSEQALGSARPEVGLELCAPACVALHLGNQARG